ncbi:xaa-Pro aminopeptidase ApepP-like isoform X2 [Plodia interpunctella]|nr:xaa-Pro aminopeptidase ApepP-like isoform X2 [Plodia interpunctella]XP_053622664.1 xaa-Pro aminopeptidase ApepP-like isoform X2 [Plodia interpunctella]XP_053622665.1 xaa-Pro aminopeptidase ApepP-like isoform X2 [Plodia interpunctella]
MSLQRLTALRALMASQPKALAAYIIPTADAHNSEYISPADARREWLSGFTGSAGTAVVTLSKALVWTDGRYYTQFEKETDAAIWTLMKQSLPDTPSMEKWLASNLNAGDVVGVDPHTMTREEWTTLKNGLKKAKMEVVPVEENLVDKVRVQLNDPAPKRPSNDIVPLPVKYTGKKAGEKIQELRTKIAEKKAAAFIVTALDEVAYTLNLRGSDIEYNPVFFSYLVITPTTVVLFCSHPLSDSVKHQLSEEGVELKQIPYEEIIDTLQQYAKTESSGECRPMWLSNEASEAVHRAASGVGVLDKPLDLISEVSPVALMKLVKNEVELQGFRNCHIRDGIAVVRFFRWLEQNVNETTISEVQAADKLLEFRKEESDFMGPSFETIPGAGPNGAVIHYSAPRSGPQHVISPKHMFLLDSGGQYKDGTTDITRTRHMSKANQEQRDAFTRVLKGQMMVGSALFPQKVKGNVLDSFARKALWDVGLDYAHGTGHGVGHFLNVHEGPSGVSWRPYPHDPGLMPGQILSNEPGYYKVGDYGIRHEDLVEVVSVTKDSDHPRAKNLVGDYGGRGVLGFRTITMVPHQRESIDVNLLDDFELNYLNNYHKKVLETLGPVLKGRGLVKDLQWLERECQPIVRA